MKKSPFSSFDDALRNFSGSKKHEASSLGDEFSQIKNFIAELVPEFRSFFESFKSTSKDAVEGGREKFDEWKEEADKKVSQNPWVFIGGAALAGFVVGLWLSRRR